jgi:hypothetical protein
MGQANEISAPQVGHCSEMRPVALQGRKRNEVYRVREHLTEDEVIATHEAAMNLYRRAWECDPADYFEGHTKYLQLADKATRTLAMLTERLDQHRGRGQQQIDPADAIASHRWSLAPLSGPL